MAATHNIDTRTKSLPSEEQKVEILALIESLETNLINGYMHLINEKRALALADTDKFKETAEILGDKIKVLTSDKPNSRAQEIANIIDEIAPSLHESKAVALTKIGCFAWSKYVEMHPIITAIREADPDTPSPFIPEADLLCNHVKDINTIYDANVNIVEGLLSEVAYLVANPMILFEVNNHSEL